MLSIRWRLALHYAAAMTVFLMVFGAIVYTLVWNSQLERIDFELEEEFTEFQIELRESLVDDQHGQVGNNDGEDSDAGPDDEHEDPPFAELQQHFGEHALYEFEVLDRTEQCLFRSVRLGEHSLRDASDEFLNKRQITQRVLPTLGEYRILTAPLNVAGRELQVQIANPLKSIRATQGMLLKTFLIAGPLVLLLATWGGYGLAGRALSPVRDITRRAGLISASDLHQRLEVSAIRDELSELSSTLNAMIARLERAFDETQRFTADAAHELRTPLTVMRTQLDVALLGDRSEAELRAVLKSLRDDVAQMSELVADLLLLSRADSTTLTVTTSSTDLTRLLKDCWQPFHDTASKKALHVEWSLPESDPISTDPRYLRLVLTNLFENAVDYCDAEGRVSISTNSVEPLDSIKTPTSSDHQEESDARDSVRVTITNSGCHLTPESAALVFQRFWRGDSARTETMTHSGLGLSVCQQVITALRGSIEARIVADTFSVTIQIPRAP